MSWVAVPVLPRWLRWGVVLAVAAVIFYLSVITAPPEKAVAPAPPDLLPLDKWRHFLAYVAFSGSLAYATVDSNWSSVRLATLVVGIAAAYGLGIEGVQAAVPNRYFSMGDAYPNVLGAVLATPWFAVRSRVPLVSVPSRQRARQSDDASRDPRK